MGLPLHSWQTISSALELEGVGKVAYQIRHRLMRLEISLLGSIYWQNLTSKFEVVRRFYIFQFKKYRRIHLVVLMNTTFQFCSECIVCIRLKE